MLDSPRLFVFQTVFAKGAVVSLILRWHPEKDIAVVSGAA